MQITPLNKCNWTPVLGINYMKTLNFPITISRPLHQYLWINWISYPTNLDPYLIILETQLITVIISTIQLTLNWDGCTLTDDKSINWHKGIIRINSILIRIDSILTIKCSHSLTTMYPRHRGVDLSWPHSLVTQSKWIDRNLNSSMSQDWESIARKL